MTRVVRRRNEDTIDLTKTRSRQPELVETETLSTVTQVTRNLHLASSPGMQSGWMNIRSQAEHT